MEPLEPTDKLIRNWVKDTGAFVECWEFEDVTGETYIICCDQNGGEWFEE